MKIVTRRLARDADLKKYFTGTPCKNGHIAERYTQSGTCAECLAESNGQRNITPADLEARNARQVILSQLAEIKLRARPVDWPTLRDTAAALCVGRHPTLTLADVVSTRPGYDSISGVLLYKVLVDGADIELMHQTEQALLNRYKPDTSATEAERQRKMIEAEEPAPAWSERP